MAGQYPADEFIDDIATPSGPPVILGMELTPGRIGIAIGLLGVLAAGLLAFTNLRPLLQQIQQTENEIDQTTNTLTSVRQQIDSLSNVETDIEDGRRVNARVSELLPTPENVDTQLLDLSRLMQQSDVQMRSFAPSEPVPADATSAPEVPADIAFSIEVQNTNVAMRGEYDDIISLMSNVERLETLLRVRNLNIQFTEDPTQLVSAFTLTAYIYDRDATPPPPPEGAEGAAPAGEAGTAEEGVE
jgi:Tfp pilus assembly protein PilO